MNAKCQVCGKEFNSTIALNQHKKSKGHGRSGAKQAVAKAIAGKANNCPVTHGLLEARYERSRAKGYAKQKWIVFCEAMLAMGFHVTLYDARRTFSKYLTVSFSGRFYKVRFSNHRPIRSREEANDCDFFVGVCNHATTTTDDAIAAVKEYFGGLRAAS